MKITLTELAAGEGWNEGPEVRVYVQTDELMDLPRIVAALSPDQRTIFDKYGTQTDYEPILIRDGYRFTEERTFTKR